MDPTTADLLKTVLPAAIGVIGTLVGFAVSAYSDRGKRGLEDRYRFAEARREIYTRTLHALRRCDVTLTDFGTIGGDREVLKSAMDDLFEAESDVLLIAPPWVVEPLQDAVSAHLDVASRAMSGSMPAGDAIAALNKRTEMAKQAMRRNIGVTFH